MYWRLLSLEEIIQIWDTWKGVMGLQVRAFKNCSKWTLAYKDYWRWSSIYFICSSCNWKESKKYWNTPIHLENNRPSIKVPLIFWFLIMTLNLCFYHQLWVKCIHIGNSSGDTGQSPSRFLKSLSMFDTEWNAHLIGILDNLFD